jgi:glycerate 2-kinase
VAERSALRRDLDDVIRAAVEAVEPRRLLAARLRREGLVLGVGDARVDLARYASVRVASVGKAARGMAEGWLALGLPADECLLVAPSAEALPGFVAVAGEHPTPGAGSERAGRALLDLAEGTRESDLLVLLLSGGASALAEAPAVPLADLAEATRLLLAAGADVRETNAVRKHLSRLKGGGLARAARGDVLALVLSDVPGDDLAVVGSGPATPDPTTYRDAFDALARRGLLDRVPASVRRRIEDGLAGRAPETPKPGDPAFSRARAFVLGGNAAAVEAALARATALGYRAVEAPPLSGEARDAGLALARRLLAEAASGRPVVLVAGGETVVTVRGPGQGGRNQEAALAAVEALAGANAALAFVGTDGVDGPTDAAGAVVDGASLARARALGLDPTRALAANDSHPFFVTLGDLVLTGPTGTNVADVAVGLARGRDA